MQINEITKEGVLYEHSEEAHLAKADQVIIAMGANPNLDLSNALQARTYPVNSYRRLHLCGIHTWRNC